MHFDFSIIGSLLLGIFAAPAAQLVAAKRDQVKAQAEHLKAQAATIKNPVKRELAEIGASLAPVALDAAGAALQISRDHVVGAVSKVNPDAGQLVGTLIDTALTPPPASAALPQTIPSVPQPIVPPAVAGVS